MSKNSESTLQIGTVILDKWVILEFLAKGGMGEVYRAHQINLKRDVAIKIVSSEWLESVADNKDELEMGLQRFRNEVQAMAQIRHPNVLQIYDYGSFSVKKGVEALSMEYIVMEYVPGGTLRSTMSEDGFYPEEELVKSDGIVWMLLGEVAKGYEPIIFTDGKFMVKDPIYHSHPVVRVTALGATAYAEYYGRRLPTAGEWFRASRTGNSGIQGDSVVPSGQSANSHTEMMSGHGQTPSPEDQKQSEIPVSVTQSLPDQYGIRGLDRNVDEWGIIAPVELPQMSKERKYGVFPEGVARRPWEAFKNVGFRTVLPVSK